MICIKFLMESFINCLEDIDNLSKHNKILLIKKTFNLYI